MEELVEQFARVAGSFVEASGGAHRRLRIGRGFHQAAAGRRQARHVMSAIVRCGLGTIGLVLLSATVVGAQSPASSPQAPAAQKPPPGSQSGKPDARELANQVNNPAAPVTLLQFRNLLFPSVEGTDGATNALEIQPVLPIGPFASFRYLQLIKITLPFPSLPSPVSAAGVGDLQVFDVFVFKAVLGAVGSWTSAGVSYGIRQRAR